MDAQIEFRKFLACDADTVKMPRNGADKKYLDVQIGSANLPVGRFRPDS